MNRMERIQRINEVEVAMIQKDENLLDHDRFSFILKKANDILYAFILFYCVPYFLFLLWKVL
jgi:hypothetical protein